MILLIAVYKKPLQMKTD